MANKKKFDLKTANSRRSITIGPKLHVTYLREGLHVGYRKTKLKGAWFGRKYNDVTKNYTFHPLAVADDAVEANGIDVLSFDQAAERAVKWFEEEMAKETGAINVKKTYTIADLMTEYLADREMNGCKSLHKIRQTTKTHILPTFAEIPLRKLNHYQVEHWLNNLAHTVPLKRTRQGRETALLPTDASEECKRQRKATANRIFNLFRAALNFAYRKHKVVNQQAWDKVSAFPTVNRPRIVEMTIDEARRLIECCEPDFRRLVQGALLTGCRYGELCAFKVQDFSARHGHIFIETSKNGHSRFVPLSDEGLEFFSELTKDREPNDFLFVKADGTCWTESLQKRRISKALKTARIDKPITFHQLRHAFASLSLENGMRLEEIGTVLGHLDLKITQRYYARFSKDHMQETVRQFAPRLRSAAPQNDPHAKGKVIPIGQLRNAS